MASLKELRNRIASVQATQKITKALNMVAAAKLRRSREAAENARPYAERMAAVIANLARGVSEGAAPPLLVGTGRDHKELVVVATFDRGLAGAFNSQVVRAAREHIAGRIAAGKQVSILTIGRKGRDQLRRAYGDRFVGALEAGANVTLARAQEAADIVLKRFFDGEVDVVTLIYNRFVSVVLQKATAKRLVPAEVGDQITDLKGAIYDYEPDEETILRTLLPRNITTQIFSAMLENHAGFFASQMTAMDNATRNAGDMIRKQTLIYNRTRQAMITKELIEIISGAEAI
ncbi:MAG TPA: F0F1 ATP synthase subunit gamma [Caulobacteraceae bacterium]|nr:F0F1 ATP synthase subunit gamma [Caulobacteraceae bacterium]